METNGNLGPEAGVLSRAAAYLWSRWPLPRGKTFVMRNFLHRLMQGDVVVADHRGNRFRSSLKFMMTHTLMAGDGFERPLVDYLCDRIVEEKITGFIDVGANIGLYSVAVGGLEPVEKVISFDPNPVVFQYLAFNLELNGISADTHRLALSNEKGSREFYIETGGPLTYVGKSSLYSIRESAGFAATTVEAVRFDDLYDFENERLAIKMDIEGAEAEALAGMARTLRKNEVLLQVEIFPENMDAVTRQLKEMGFVPVGTPPDTSAYPDNFYFVNYGE